MTKMSGNPLALLPRPNRAGKKLMNHRTTFLEKQLFHHNSGNRCLLRRKVFSLGLVGALAALEVISAFAPILSAQTGQPLATTKTPAATPAATSVLSHDLSGVWMQYPDGNVPGVPGMNAVDDRTRPPLTPWGKAKFDAAKPLVGPRAVPGVENNPELRCDPDGPPQNFHTSPHLFLFFSI